MATTTPLFARARPPLLQLGLVLSGVAALMFAACAGPADASPLAMVQEASATTAVARTARISMAVDGGALKNVSFDGVMDFTAQRMRLTVDGSELGIPGATGKVDAVMDFRDKAVEFIRFPGLADEFGGKHWLKIDLAAGLKSLCPDVDLTGLLQAQSGDPTSGLRMLEGAKQVTKLGGEVVRGVNTKHYHVIVDVTRAVDRAPAGEREAMRKLVDMFTSTEQSADVWLDDQGRVRRYEQAIDFTALKLPPCLSSAQAGQADPFKGAKKIVFEMYDFGAATSIELPSAGDVVDSADVLADR